MNAIDIDAMNKLLSDQLQYDTHGKLIVTQPDGTPRLAADGVTPMTIEALYLEFSAKSPWLVKGQTIPGAGSSESQRSALPRATEMPLTAMFGPRATKEGAAYINRLSLRDERAYKQLRAMAKQKGLVN